MGDDVSREVVLGVLKAHGVTVDPMVGDLHRVVRGTVLWRVVLPPRVDDQSQRLLHRWFDIPLDHFHHPELLARR